MTYRVAARWNDQASRMKAMATSVYANRDGGWKLAAHQQTPVQQPGMLVAGSVEGRPVRAGALGALALGACAMGAVALGAVAVGRLAVGSLALGRARVRRLTVGELTIGTLRVRESLVRGVTPL